MIRQNDVASRNGKRIFGARYAGLEKQCFHRTASGDVNGSIPGDNNLFALQGD